MNNPLTLRHFAARAAALSAPDRELDCLIAAEVDWTPAHSDFGTNRALSSWGLERLVELSDNPQNIFESLPRYTRSLDAIHSLLPDGWGSLEAYRPFEDAVVWSVYYHTSDGALHEGFGETYEYALLSAALNGRAHQQKKR